MSVFLAIKRSIWAGLGLSRCHQLTYLISQSLDQKLTLSQRLIIKLHFMGCRKCARYEKQLRLIRNTIVLQRRDFAAYQPAPGAASLSPEARERLKKLLSADARQKLQEN